MEQPLRTCRSLQQCRRLRTAQFLRFEGMHHDFDELRIGLEIKPVHQAIKLIQIVEVENQLTSAFFPTRPDLHTSTQVFTKLTSQFLVLMSGDIH